VNFINILDTTISWVFGSTYTSFDISSWNASYKAKGNINWYTADFSDPVGREVKQSLFVTSTLSRFESASIWYSLSLRSGYQRRDKYSLKLSNLMTDFTESIAFISIVKIFICRYSPWQIRIFANCNTPALSLPPANFIVISGEY
jgi:hypothetical protein